MSEGLWPSSPLYYILSCKRADLCRDAAFSHARTADRGVDEVELQAGTSFLLNFALRDGKGGAELILGM